MTLDVRVAGMVIGLAAAGVVFRPTWRIVRYAVTAVHELGHVIVAVTFGGRAARVRLHADTSGLTTWTTTQPGRLRAALVALAGPALPPLVGAGCALAFASDRSVAGVLVLAVGVAAIAVIVRNVWGWVVCAALGAICWWAWRGGVGAAQVLMVATATVLCLGGVRAVAEEMGSRSSPGVRDTDVAARALWLPPALWGVGLLVWAVAWAGWATWRVTLAL